MLAAHRLSGAIATSIEAPAIASGGTGAPDDVTPHTLRHSVAYRIVREEGERLEDVQLRLRLRHRHLQTTDQVYAHLVPR
jgi:integrase